MRLNGATYMEMMNSGGGIHEDEFVDAIIHDVLLLNFNDVFCEKGVFIPV